MDYNEMKKRLMEMGLPSAKALFYSDLAKGFAPDLRAAFERFVETGQPCEFSYNGWTLAAVMEHTFSEPPYSYIYFDRMMKNAKYAAYFGEMDFCEE